MSKEKPIIFSTEMVKTILDGRKTMTRRVVKHQAPEGYRILGRVTSSTDKENEGCACWRSDDDRVSHYCKIPYEAGDVLWVRETWNHFNYNNDHDDKRLSGYIFKASPEFVNDLPPLVRAYYGVAWCPSIHMPRAAARLFLKVKDIRVERLQGITVEDIRSEGLSSMGVHCLDYELAIPEWKILWDSINAKRGYGWDINPWVWVVEFERVESHG